MIYDHARGFMRETGNPAQWGQHYPSRELVVEDIVTNNCYVCDNNDNKVMQKVIINNGFKKCGIIHAYDGSPRIAFDYTVE